MTTIIYTRPSAHGRSLRDALTAAGVGVVDFPLLQIGPPADAEALQRTLAELDRCALAVPVSPTAVQAAFAALDRPWPASCAIGVVGSGSQRAVRQALERQNRDLPWPRVITPSDEASEGEGDTDALWQVLQGAFPAQPGTERPWQGRRVVILHGGPGREELALQLEDSGAEVIPVQAYTRRAPPWNADTEAGLRRALAARGWWLLTSTSALRTLQDMLTRANIGGSELRAQRAVAIHPRIALAARQAGFGAVLISTLEPQALLTAVRTAPELPSPHGPARA